MRLMPRSVRSRVALLFAVGASIAVAACLALLYVALDRQLTVALDEDLGSRSEDLAAAVRAGETGVVSQDPLAQLYSTDGTILAGSPSLGPARLLSADEVRGIADESRLTRSVARRTGPEPESVRLLSRRLDPGRVLTVGVSTEPLHASRQRLLEVLLLAAPLLVGVVAGGGWLVVRAALRPVDVLTREAAEISSVEADRRLPEVPGDDEIARLARTLEEMLGRLRLSFERERAFVDDASHELRSPIAVLRGEIELALSAVDEPEEVQRSLRAALGEADRLARLADDLLLLARERAGSLVVRREPVDLLDLAGVEAGRIGPVLGLTIETSGEPAVVDGDPDRLRQLLANLAHNSAAAGATTVQMQVTRRRATAVVEIADDGPGFPIRTLGSAFERFYRGDQARTRGASGAGLGLAIVRAIVVAHGGTVDARNGEPLGGAVVTVHLPLN